MIKVKIIYMARKPKRNQEAYTRLGFPQNKNDIQNKTIQLGVTQELDQRLRK